VVEITSVRPARAIAAVRVAELEIAPHSGAQMKSDERLFDSKSRAAIRATSSSISSREICSPSR